MMHFGLETGILPSDRVGIIQFQFHRSGLEILTGITLRLILSLESGRASFILPAVFMKNFLSRHMSLSLALRYLNPLRTYFSVITLICLLGVSLGVMVLIIVLSVMGGLQKELQERLLAYSPHLQMNYYAAPGLRGAIGDWRTLEETINKVPGVESTYALVEDYALVDVNGAQRPCSFRALDTENKEQMAELAPLLSSGSFDLGLGENAVVSSTVARMLGLSVNDKLRVFTTRNYGDAVRAFSQMDRPLLATRFETELDRLLSLADKKRPNGKDGVVWNGSDVRETVSLLQKLDGSPRLQVEAEAIGKVLDVLPEDAFGDDVAGELTFPANVSGQLKAMVSALKLVNKDKEDINSVRMIKSLILPKDLTVIGIYQASQHVTCPDLFIPLEIGQELQGFEDDYVQAIAIRTKNPYDLAQVTADVEHALPVTYEGSSGWGIESWMDKYSSWFKLIQQERMMMGFVLSFIGMIAAFCIMAVMFTVSIQRKKELALMKALGATPWQVVRVFLWQGVIIGIAGAALGVALALLVLHYRVQIHIFLKTIGIDPFPMDFHGVEIPAEINPAELLNQSVKAFVMVVVASVVPAVLTAYQDPAKALRSM